MMERATRSQVKKILSEGSKKKHYLTVRYKSIPDFIIYMKTKHPQVHKKLIDNKYRNAKQFEIYYKEYKNFLEQQKETSRQKKFENASKKERSKLEKELKVKDKLISKIENESRTLKTEITNKDNELLRLNTKLFEIEESKKLSEKEKEELAFLRKENYRLEKESSSLKNTIRQKNTELTNTRITITNLENRGRNQKTAIQKKDERINNLQLKIKNYKNLELENDKLQRRISELELEIDKFKNYSVYDLITSFGDSVSRLNSDIQSLKQNHSSLSAQINSYNNPSKQDKTSREMTKSTNDNQNFYDGIVLPMLENFNLCIDDIKIFKGMHIGFLSNHPGTVKEDLESMGIKVTALKDGDPMEKSSRNFAYVFGDLGYSHTAENFVIYYKQNYKPLTEGGSRSKQIVKILMKELAG